MTTTCIYVTIRNMRNQPEAGTSPTSNAADTGERFATDCGYRTPPLSFSMLIGKTVAEVDLQPEWDAEQQKWIYRPVIAFTDGSHLRFLVQEIFSVDGIQPIYTEY